MMSLIIGLSTQVSGSESRGPLVSDYLHPAPSLRKPSVSPTSAVKLPTKATKLASQRTATGDSLESSLVSPYSPSPLADMFGKYKFVF